MGEVVHSLPTYNNEHGQDESRNLLEKSVYKPESCMMKWVYTP